MKAAECRSWDQQDNVMCELQRRSAMMSWHDVKKHRVRWKALSSGNLHPQQQSAKQEAHQVQTGGDEVRVGGSFGNQPWAGDS